MPPSTTPLRTTRHHIQGLGVVEGFEFPKGVRQFCGIPYATITKRWTRSKLNTSWPNDFHNGTKLGCSAPQPPEYKLGDPMIPVAPTSHYDSPMEDEYSCLVMNITVPPVETPSKVPVMVYIHGGSWLFGGSFKPAYDNVNLVTHSISRNTPVIAVNLNYRIGLGGFLASSAIKADLEADGYSGVGNFGLYDQQVALHWVNRYIASFGGDPNNVTIYGQSAGGMSVAHQMAAKEPAPFNRAILMSGQLNTLPTWSLEQHEKHYRALLTYLQIDPDSPSALEQLRSVPQSTIAKATLPLEGVFLATGNPCDDGVFHAEKPSFDKIASPPAWIKSYMVGDVHDDGVIARQSFANENFASVRDRMAMHIGTEATNTILPLYEITPDISQEQLIEKLEAFLTDGPFRVQNWLSAHRSEIPQTFGYHFDQICTHEGPFNGLAYHCLELLYLFLNFDEKLTPKQQELSRAMAGHFLDFAYGKDPWPRVRDGDSWMRYGPNDEAKLVTESEDEPVRKYSRMRHIMDLGLYQGLEAAADEIAIQRFRMGTFEWKPPVQAH